MIMLKREGRGKEGRVEQFEREAPIAPLGSQLDYSEMLLAQVRSAPTNMGWKSVFVTFLLAIACAGLTSAYYLMNEPEVNSSALIASRGYLEEGDRLLQAGSYDAAIVEYNKAIVSRNNYDRAYYKRGIAYEAKGDKEESAASYRKALELTRDETLKQDIQGRLQRLQPASP